MKYLTTVATCLVALALHGTAWAQVYETKDADGNPEFTDAPAAENAEVIDLQQTNIADAPRAEPQNASQPNAVQAEQAPQQQNTTVNVNVNGGYDTDGYDDGAYDDDLARQRAIERRDAAPGEVGDPGYEMPREVGDSEAQMPREVGDSESQMPREVGDTPDVTGAHRR